MPRRKTLTWPRALDAHLLALQARRASPRTLDGHQRELNHLRERVLPLRPDQVRLTDLREYQCALLTGEGTRSGKPMSAGTVAKVTSTLRAFFSVLVDEGLLTSDPTLRLERPKVPPRLPGDTLTTKEVKKLLAAAGTPTPTCVRDRALVELLYATGLRRAECLALDLSDLDHRQREVVVRHGKGDKPRIVPLTPSAYAGIQGYTEHARSELVSSHPDSASALFLSSKGRRLGNVALLRLLRELGRQAGLKKNVTPHCLRRSFATGLMRSGASLRVIQLLLGHANLNTTATYLRLDADELRRELILRHPRERFEL